MAKQLTEEEKVIVDGLIRRARAAQEQINDLDQDAVDRAIRAVAWASANEKTYARISQMGTDESGLGDRENRPARRSKIIGILRDCLRQKSVGIIEEIPEKGIVKYGKPVGVIASLIPATNPALTPPGIGIFAVKARNAVVFAPHPRGRRTTFETVRVMRAGLKKVGLPEDLYVCIEKPSIPSSQYLMSQADLTVATGGSAMVKAAYSSGRPAYGVGAGNATMVFDETTSQDIATAAKNVRMSKTNDFGSGCSADGNLMIHDSVYGQLLAALQAEGGYLCNADEKAKLTAILWDDELHRTMDTIAISAASISQKAGFLLPEGKTFLLCEENNIGPVYPWCSEKMAPVIGVFKYSGSFANLRCWWQGTLLRNLLFR
jgi:sulfoacetaldehyde dehydrogenase